MKNKTEAEKAFELGLRNGEEAIRLRQVNPQTEIERQIPGFRIICVRCGSGDIKLTNDLAVSEDTGPWGSIQLVCQNCGGWATIYEP